MIRPKERHDLMLAPVASEIDKNLQPLRELSVSAIEEHLQLKLDAPLIDNTRDGRAQRIMRIATRNVDMHGWEATVNADASAVHLEGGSVSLDLALSPTLRQYVENGLPAE